MRKILWQNDSLHRPANLNMGRKVTRIEEVLAPEEVLERNEAILEQLADVRDLPTLPAVFMKIMRLMQNPHSSIREISLVVEADQSIAMKILRLINSSFYGLSRSVYSVQQAIVLLGSNTLKNILITASVFQALGKKSGEAGLNREAFWQHAIGCAMIARCLDDKINSGKEEEGFIGGIIHDIGKVVLDQYFHDKLLAILRQVRRQDMSFYQAEMELLGVSHAEIGAKLAEYWYLPANLVEVIAQHHEFQVEGDFARQTALIQISDMLARKYHVGNGGDGLIPDVDPLCWKSLDLDPNQIDAWEQDIRAEIDKGKELLNLMLD
jgi:putative nucleotidyltransferase with HDIG domain